MGRLLPRQGNKNVTPTSGAQPVCVPGDVVYLMPDAEEALTRQTSMRS